MQRLCKKISIFVHGIQIIITMEKKGHWFLGCGAAAIVGSLLGIILAVGGYFLWHHLSSSDETKGEEETAVVQTEETLAQLLAKAEWEVADGGYRYPKFMRRTDSFVADVPASVKVCNWTDVDLCYWPLIGAWAVDNESFPVKKCYVTASALIDDVTYKAESKGIFSGHTADGRIFYLKKSFSEGDATRHVRVLAIVYPESLQNDVQPFIDMIQNW